MKQIGLIFCLCLVACGPSTESSTSLSGVETPSSLGAAQDVKTTAWLALKDQQTSLIYAYLREDTHTFRDKSRGKVYTVFDINFTEKGHVSAEGRVLRYRKNRYTKKWEAEFLGIHSLLKGTSLLIQQKDLDLKRLDIVMMDLSDVMKEESS